MDELDKLQRLMFDARLNYAAADIAEILSEMIGDTAVKMAARADVPAELIAAALADRVVAGANIVRQAKAGQAIGDGHSRDEVGHRINVEPADFERALPHAQRFASAQEKANETGAKQTVTVHGRCNWDITVTPHGASESTPPTRPQPPRPRPRAR